ncbi:uncharacterized protein LOC131307774 [Rhododendron vialii]|uniref:uncharacterized protein LOC131307774 n=1 Tax=Rhododendron vialii TaxID=182163 RepID=UPI00265D7F25|nr:uncharacterized protein LOC131307774 [Rhododendron vialii]
MNKTWLAMQIRSSLLSLMSGGRRIEDDHFAVIDILRMNILHPDGATRLLKHVDKSDVLIEMINNVTSSPPLPANLLTSIRAVTNVFKNSCYYPWLQKHRSEILDAFSSCCSSPNKNVQVSYANLILK